MFEYLIPLITFSPNFLSLEAPFFTNWRTTRFAPDWTCSLAVDTLTTNPMK